MVLANRGFNNLFYNDPFFTKSAQVMRTDINEKGDDYVLEVELPGFAKEDIKVDLKDKYLTITAEKTTEKNEESTENEENDEVKDEKDAKDEKVKYIHKERYTGTCKRSFYVGDALKEEDIKASFKDGVLSVEFPKNPEKEVEEEKLIPIE